MADIVVTIPVSTISFSAWLRSSYIAASIADGEGAPKIEEIEIGPDQENIFNEYMNEGALEVAKIFSSRQGDVTGVPFENDGTDVTYRFNEGKPVLGQSVSLKSQLNEDVKNAIYSYIAILWFNSKDIANMAKFYVSKYDKISLNIQRNLYLLHD